MARTHSTKCRFWSSKLRGLVRLQLISENYSRCLSIFRVFTQPGANSELESRSRRVRSTPDERTSSPPVGMSQRCQLRKSTFGQESLAHYAFVARSVGLAAA